MLSQGDEDWLRDFYPSLALAGDGVAGEIDFTASYDERRNLFFIVPNQSTEKITGMVLSGDFQIRIVDRTDKTFSQLPALFVDGIDPIPDRHFSQRDKSACLCNPFDEWDLLEPKFRFPEYLEQLVIPFLYGQVYFSLYRRWPWDEYAHGAAGILEAYSKNRGQGRVEECLRQIKLDSMNWPGIQAALQQEPYIKGHTPCFCGKLDHARRCHPRALEGARRLQEDLRARNISIL
jgi:hypothetical protein